jgi:Spy/CpxP family protein refolding chaperone
MKNAMTRIATGLLVATLAAGSGIALTSLALAQTAAPTPPMPPHHPGMGGPGGPEMRHGMGGGRHMMMEVERLKTSLKLNASQTALWDKAQGLMKPPTDLREQMRARRDRMAAMLDDPNFEPRKLASEMDAAESERRAKMTAVRDAWFAVYDSLNPVQRGQAREFLRSHMGHPHGGGGGMEGHMDWKHRPEGDAGKPPMAPPR